MKRAAGILLPIFSLPGKYGIGCFSKEAYRFVDFLAEAGQSYWQILPIGPTGFGDSPYQSFSTFAGNPYFIDLEEWILKGWLTEEECEKTNSENTESKIDYGFLFRNRFPLYRKAFERSPYANGLDSDEGFRSFIEKNSEIPDYALFMALKDFFNGKPFYEWPEEFRHREETALQKARGKFQKEILFYEFLQYEFDSQWQKLKRYANDKGIEIIGDLPIYVARDSADFWKHGELFLRDENGYPSAVAGCPPDAFSEDGQLWGNPLYDWEKMKADRYSWWLQRISKAGELYDIIRMDHFRGFSGYYSIPYGKDNAKEGEWKRGPGYELFESVLRELPDVKIIAEDLGYLTEDVYRLLTATGFPGMNVLQFAFYPDSLENPSKYIPCFHGKNSIVYTGTHDNETLFGYCSHLDEKTKEIIRNYAGEKNGTIETLTDCIIEMALSSVADTAVIPLADYLRLGNEARINEPSTVGKNWQWRVRKEELTFKVASEIKMKTKKYYR